jgi:selenocysteine-specific elongation factor
MALLIGTAGHVDHGKTSLIRALTGIDTDRLPEEKARGMTIDIGFAAIDLPGLGKVSIVDVPGHEKFVTNMLVGALGIDVALLCVSADEGVMPQTREHFEILGLLPVNQMVVALTRADLADEDTQALARQDVAELLEGSRFAGSPIIATSVESGSGIAALRTALVKALSDAKAKPTGPWYLPIDRAFTVKGHGLVITGTLAQGTVKVGDRAVLMPGQFEARIRKIHCHDEERQEAHAGQRTALNLGGINKELVHRGMAIGEPGALVESTRIDARVEWMKPPDHGKRVRVSIGAEEAMARAFLNDHDSNLVQLRLETSVACAPGQPLIIRQYSPPVLLGGGSVTVANAVVRRKSEQTIQLGETSVSGQIVEIVERSPKGAATEDICRLLGRTPQALGTTFESLVEANKLVGFAGVWYTPNQVHEMANHLVNALSKAHESEPTKAYLNREQVLDLAGIALRGKPLDRFLSFLAGDGRIILNGTMLKSSEFQVRLSGRQEELLTRVENVVESAGWGTPPNRDIARQLGVPTQAVDDIFRLGREAGRLVLLEDGIVYTVRQIGKLKEWTATTFGDRAFAAAEFRDQLGTSRKYAIPLLEHLDSIRFTIRSGDTRIIRKA